MATKLKVTAAAEAILEAANSRAAGIKDINTAQVEKIVQQELSDAGLMGALKEALVADLTAKLGAVSAEPGTPPTFSAEATIAELSK